MNLERDSAVTGEREREKARERKGADGCQVRVRDGSAVTRERMERNL